VDARELFNGGAKWTDVTARVAFPIVLRRAKDGYPITYGDLNEAVKATGKKGVWPLTYRYVAGKIGDICEALSEDFGKPIPLLNTIITGSKSGLPSDGVDGYLARFLGKKPREIASLSQPERDVYARQAMQNVFSFVGWDQIGKYLGLRDIARGSKKSGRGKPIPPPDPRGFATGPETDAHKALKVWVANNPGLVFAFGKFKNGKAERRLSSGDRLDVFFSNNRQMLAVEVKAAKAEAAEVERGVYQCVKYRATLQAMQIAAAKPPNGNAVLIVERAPAPKTMHLAKRLSVKIIIVGVHR
jgi:hypothetical protein